MDLQPRIDLGVDYLSMDGFSESGGSDFRIRHNGEDTTYVNLQPAIDIATELETGDGLLIRPKLSLGITQFIGASAPSVTGSFASTPAEVAPFKTSTEQDKTRFDVAASVDVFTRKDVVVRAELFGSFSGNTQSYRGGLKVELPFCPLRPPRYRTQGRPCRKPWTRSITEDRGRDTCGDRRSVMKS